MKKLISTSLICALSVACLQAQVTTLRNRNFTPTGVSNEGLAVGFTDMAQPYKLWNPKTNEFKEIGGIAEGEGHGGRARFSADGKYIGGSYYTLMDWSEDWTKHPQYEQHYTITDIGISDDVTLFAVGKNPEDPTQKGVLLKSGDGMTWSKLSEPDAIVKGGVEAISFPVDYVGFIGGHNGYFAYSTNKGAGWKDMDPRPEGCTDEVKVYRTIDFIKAPPYAGVVGAELADGKYAIYQTPDGAESWATTKGVLGIPVQISHQGNIFYMVTQNGHIQKSIDNGLNWTDLYKADTPLHKVEFSPDGRTGFALSDGIIYKTMDGGKNWTKIELGTSVGINPLSGDKATQWNDVLWQDEANAIVIGSNGEAFSTDNRGASWKEMTISNDGLSLNAIATNGAYLMVGSVDGTFYRKVIKMPQVSMMGRYNTETEEWQALGTLGQISQVSAGSGYYISADGKTIVGLCQTVNQASTQTVKFAHAAAWNEEKGMINLGGLYDNIGRSTRANAVNEDGSVIVGWQDQAGPWHGVVWRRNANGEYSKPQWILKDPAKGGEEITNRAGDAQAVSPNGKWIGGAGKNYAIMATEGPWIWSEETGLEELSSYGTVTGINNDGTMAVGYAGTGFIWTREYGWKTANDYVEQVLKYDMGEVNIMSILNMSHNGRYLCGWGMEGQSRDVIGIIIDLGEEVGIKDATQEKYSVNTYPNPVSDVLHVNIPNQNVNAQIRLMDAQGRIIFSQNTTSSENSFSMNNVASGLYFVQVIADGMRKTFKVEVVH